ERDGDKAGPRGRPEDGSGSPLRAPANHQRFLFHPLTRRPQIRTVPPAILVTLAWSPHHATADEPPARGAVTFEQDVKPILRKHCVNCHNAERPRGELDLTQYSGVMTGGTSGKAGIAGKPDESPVYTLPSHLDDPRMPPNKPKIPQRELDLIRDWIAGGLVEKSATKAVTSAAPAPGGLTPANALARATPVTALAAHP